jgi:hypothetical protein
VCRPRHRPQREPHLSGRRGLELDGGDLDCNALATAGKLVSIYSTFFTAENISDLSNLDGTVHVTMGRHWSTTGAFWDGTSGACLDAHGGAVKFVGSKPVNGDPCGTRCRSGSASRTARRRRL